MRVEFLFGIIAADVPGGLGRQDAIGADDFAAAELAHQQVVAERIVQVDVVSRQDGRQPRAHFFGEDLVAQTLRFADFAVVHRQRDVVAAGGGKLKIAADVEHGALPLMECAQLREPVLIRRDVLFAK